MIEKVYLVRSESINPYYNLALEDYLFHNIPADSMIFYLWQNQNTVVVGKNQNAYKECDLKAMEYDHCYLARRSSGGGAVFHDLGNQCYSFIMYLDSYDIKKQSETIAHALHMLGLTAEVTGRNDITVNERKVSGNAYLAEKEHCLHHGTVLWKTDKEKAGKYLSVSNKKVQAKGVDSVSSRIANITEFNENITLEDLQKALIEAIRENYGEITEMAVPEIPDEILEHYHSYKFLYNTISKYTVIVSDYYSFGETQFYFDIEKGTVRNLDVYTDAMDSEFDVRVKKLFRGMHVDDVTFKKRLNEVFKDEYHDDMVEIYNDLKKQTY